MAKKGSFGITDNTSLRRNPDMVFSEVDGEVVMLSIQNGEYYNLNEVSTDIWLELKEACSFKDLVTRLQDTYDVPYETCEHETRIFLEQTLDKGIIEIINDKSKINY